tara:strand:- start:337 stop:456 length:120 start_codon:yes stop_codon:yes gene_type:complete
VALTATQFGLNKAEKPFDEVSRTLTLILTLIIPQLEPGS